MWEVKKSMANKRIMKNQIIVLLLVSMLVSGFSMQTKKKIIFFGDSITQAAVETNGYIKRMDSILQQKGQDKNYELAGAGISSNKVYDLYLRMDDDVLAKNPNAVVIFIGVNDVWHKRTSGTGTDPDKFERFYNAIIKKLKDKNISVYLCTPAAIGEKTDVTNPLDGDLNLYASIVRKIAKNNGCALIDLRQAFLDHLKANNPDNKDRGILTTDGVHLNRAGNIFVAQQMYHVLSKDFIK
jgi:lysophospholipase L1-like esterase